VTSYISYGQHNAPTRGKAGKAVTHQYYIHLTHSCGIASVDCLSAAHWIIAYKSSSYLSRVIHRQRLGSGAFPPRAERALTRPKPRSSWIYEVRPPGRKGKVKNRPVWKNSAKGTKGSWERDLGKKNRPRGRESTPVLESDGFVCSRPHGCEELAHVEKNEIKTRQSGDGRRRLRVGLILFYCTYLLNYNKPKHNHSLHFLSIKLNA